MDYERENKEMPTEGLASVETLDLVYKGRAMKDLLDRLQDLGHHDTLTDTVASALRVYELILQEQEKGSKVLIHPKDGSTPLPLTFLPRS